MTLEEMEKEIVNLKQRVKALEARPIPHSYSPLEHRRIIGKPLPTDGQPFIPEVEG